MKSLPHLCALVIAAMCSAACFSSQTVLKLHPDGTGTIEQTNLVNTAMIGMASGMAKSMGGENAEGGNLPVKPEELFSEDQLKKQADQMGKNVRFVSSERLTNGAMQGAKAIYAFDRIEDVTVGSSMKVSGDDASVNPSASRIQFALAPNGAQKRLTVTFPDPKPTDTPAPSGAAPAASERPQIPPEAFAMVKSMFDGARMSIDVEVDGPIISTNAPASSGSRATLVEVDFGELLSDPSKLQMLQTLKPGVDFATVRKTLEGVKGVKMPAQPTVTIDFGK